ncbi:MAG: LrgB family protein [Duodenibacillus sp.]|nr:LrgB family protein [Duodenibacillus sp.]
MNALLTTWEALRHEPIFWLTLTVLSYYFGIWLCQVCPPMKAVPPVATSIVLLIAFLYASGTNFQTYFQGGQLLHALLGPATVALAVPLYEQRSHLSKLWLPLTVGLIVGALVAMVSAMVLAKWFGASFETVISLAPKSITVPIAMGVSEALGGIPSLTAASVVITGAIGCAFIRPVARLLKEKDEAVIGFSTGLAAHGLGTAGAFLISRKTGAFSGLGMGLTGLFTAFTAPFVVPLFLALLY